MSRKKDLFKLIMFIIWSTAFFIVVFGTLYEVANGYISNVNPANNFRMILKWGGVFFIYLLCFEGSQKTVEFFAEKFSIRETVARLRKNK